MPQQSHTPVSEMLHLFEPQVFKFSVEKKKNTKHCSEIHSEDWGQSWAKPRYFGWGRSDAEPHTGRVHHSQH